MDEQTQEMDGQTLGMDGLTLETDGEETFHTFATQMKMIAYYLQNGSHFPGCGKKMRRTVKKATIKNKYKLGEEGDLFSFYDHRKIWQKIVTTEEERRIVLSKCHSESGEHSDIKTTTKKIVLNYYWRSIKNDVKSYISRCDKCQGNEKRNVVAPTFEPIEETEPLGLVVMGIIGPLGKTPEGHKYILILNDFYSRFVYCEPLKDNSAGYVARKIYNFSLTFGAPEKLVYHHDEEFINAINSQFSKEVVTPGHHQQTRDLITSTVQTMTDGLDEMCNVKKKDWEMHLYEIAFKINSQPEPITGYSPHYLMYYKESDYDEEDDAGMVDIAEVSRDPIREFVRKRLVRKEAACKKVLERRKKHYLAQKEEQEKCEAKT